MITDIGKLSDDTNKTLLKMWEVSVEPGDRTFREHRHINFEISVVLGGLGVYNTVKGIYDMLPGDVFVFSSNEPHCITKTGEKGLTLLNLHFTEQFYENLFGLGDKFPYAFYNHNNGFDMRIPSENAVKIAKLLKETRKELSGAQIGFSGKVTAIVSEIFVLLLREHGYYSPNGASSMEMLKRIECGIDCINAHFTENLTLTQIAEKCNMTPNYFSHLFKEAFNMKLWDYITAKRIENAKKLLRKNRDTLNILDIAVSCGYNNTANFNRAFKSYTGYTPTEYCKLKNEAML